MSEPKVLIGTRAYPARADAQRRQTNAQESLRRLRDVRLVNLQFASREEWTEVEGFENRGVLTLDSRSVSGSAGVLKPVAGEVFDQLAKAAEQTDCEWFGFTNADILLEDVVVQKVSGSELDAWVFCRADFDRDSPEHSKINLIGTDVFFIRVDAWKRVRRIFQNYIVGELGWDNVYTAQLLMLLKAQLCTTPCGVRHENHPTVWGTGAFAGYNGWLSVWDSGYFSRWCKYAWYLQHEGAGETATQRLETQRRVFGRRFDFNERFNIGLRRVWYGPRQPRWIRSVLHRSRS